VTDVTVTADMTMEQILDAIPAAQRALFQRYHIGGCSSCGYEPTDTLGKVCKDHNILDVNEVLTFLAQAHETDQKLQVDPAEVKRWLEADRDFSFIDVRSAEELAGGGFEHAEPMDYNDSQRYMELPKDRLIVFACATGERSLNVGSYFRGHGFTNVFCLRGGIQAWEAGTPVGS